MTIQLIPRAATPLAGAFALAVLTSAGAASAQEPAAPPPGFEQQTQPAAPPPGYAPPPAGYAPPPGYPAAPGYYPAPYGYAPQPVLGPKYMDYEDGDPVPAGYHVETKIRKGLFIGGVVTFGALYFVTALTAATIDSANTNIDDYKPLYIPAVGPFITVGTAGSRGVGTFILVVDGVAQSAGLAMAIAGLAAQQTQLVRNDIGKMHVVPLVSPTVAGLGIMGTL